MCACRHVCGHISVLTCHKPESDFQIPKLHMPPWYAGENASVEVESKMSAKLFLLSAIRDNTSFSYSDLGASNTFSSIDGANTKGSR